MGRRILQGGGREADPGEGGCRPLCSGSEGRSRFRPAGRARFRDLGAAHRRCGWNRPSDRGALSAARDGGRDARIYGRDDARGGGARCGQGACGERLQGRVRERGHARAVQRGAGQRLQGGARDCARAAHRAGQAVRGRWREDIEPSELRARPRAVSGQGVHRGRVRGAAGAA